MSGEKGKGEQGEVFVTREEMSRALEIIAVLWRCVDELAKRHPEEEFIRACLKKIPLTQFPAPPVTDQEKDDDTEKA